METKEKQRSLSQQIKELWEAVKLWLETLFLQRTQPHHPMNPLTLEYIKTGVEVATFLLSERIPATVESVRRYFRRHPNPLASQFEREQEVRLLKNLVIDPGLLGDLREDVEKAIKTYRECLRKASRPPERDACDRRAERNVCEFLNRIRDRNNEELPDFLQNEWVSYRCVRY